jgi:hypothetical protein
MLWRRRIAACLAPGLPTVIRLETVGQVYLRLGGSFLS